MRMMTYTTGDDDDDEIRRKSCISGVNDKYSLSPKFYSESFEQIHEDCFLSFRLNRCFYEKW